MKRFRSTSAMVSGIIALFLFVPMHAQAAEAASYPSWPSDCTKWSNFVHPNFVGYTRCGSGGGYHRVGVECTAGGIEGSYTMWLEGPWTRTGYLNISSRECPATYKLTDIVLWTRSG